MRVLELRHIINIGGPTIGGGFDFRSTWIIGIMKWLGKWDENSHDGTDIQWDCVGDSKELVHRIVPSKY